MRGVLHDIRLQIRSSEHVAELACPPALFTCKHRCVCMFQKGPAECVVFLVKAGRFDSGCCWKTGGCAQCNVQMHWDTQACVSTPVCVHAHTFARLRWPGPPLSPLWVIPSPWVNVSLILELQRRHFISGFSLVPCTGNARELHGPSRSTNQLHSFFFTYYLIKLTIYHEQISLDSCFRCHKAYMHLLHFKVSTFTHNS